jgi:N-acetylneuraminic acid mutarotase
MLAAALLGLAAGGGATGWEQHQPLPEPRSEVAAAARGGELVVVGGFIADGNNSARVDGYSVRDDRWRRLPDLPVQVDHAAAASAKGRVYVLGGYGVDRVPLRTAFVLANGTWRRLPPLPDGRAAAAAAVAEGRLYIVGGRDERRALARNAFVLELGASQWRTIPGPSPREHLAATASLGRVYAIGGRAAGIDTNEKAFQVYDASARRWQRLAPLPGARGGTGAAALGGHIFSVGGEQPAGTIRTVYSYDVRTQHWSPLPDLPTPRHGLGVVAASNRIWALAGGPQPGLTVSGTVESLKP